MDQVLENDVVFNHSRYREAIYSGIACIAAGILALILSYLIPEGRLLILLLCGSLIVSGILLIAYGRPQKEDTDNND